MLRIGVLALAACGAHAAAPIENQARTPCSAVTYTKDGAEPKRLIVHGDRLIAVGGEAVVSYPLAGGAPTTVVTMHVIGDAIVVGDDLVYSQYEGGGLYRVPLAGGTPVGFSDPMDGPQTIAPLAGGMFAVGGLTGLYRVGRDGKVTKFLGGEQVNVASSHGDRAYVTTDTGIAVLGASGTPTTILVPHDGVVSDLLADERGIYFMYEDLGSSISLRIAFDDLATGEIRTLAELDTGAVGLALAGGSVFTSIDDRVVRLDGGAVVPVVDTGDIVVTLTGDGSAIYYATEHGAIARACFTDAARPAPP